MPHFLPFKGWTEKTVALKNRAEAANPVDTLCKDILKVSFINITQVAPRAVPRKGIKITRIASPTMFHLPYKTASTYRQPLASGYRWIKTCCHLHPDVNFILSMPLIAWK